MGRRERTSMTFTRRRFLGALAGGAAVGVGGGLLGWHTAQALSVDRHFLTLPGLPESLAGFRILMLSDVHAGASMDADRMSSVVSFTNALEADLIVLAGDMIDGLASHDDATAFAEAFKGLHAGDVLAVPGNHEHFAGIEMCMAAFDEAGLGVLSGGHHVIERGDAALMVLGVDDPGSSTFDPPQDRAVEAVLRDAPKGPFPILVAHRPAAFEAAARLRIPLTLSGHTHGGQVGLPLRDLTPVRLLTPYVRGLYERGDARLIVSSGVGTGRMPLRLGVPPSVALITLSRAEA